MVTLGQFYLTDSVPTEAHRQIIKNAAERFFLFSYGKCGVDEARGLRALFEGVTASETVVFLIVVASLTDEAQNALLKIMEELPKNISVIVSVPNISALLPTLISRAQFLLLEGNDEKKDVDTFLHMTYSERLVFIAKLTDTKKYEDTATMRKEVKHFLRQVQAKMSSDIDPTLTKLFYTVYTLLDADASHVKSILEYFALSVPYDSM